MSGSHLLAVDLEDQTVTQDIMTDGIMQIAGGIETMVQQLQLQVRLLVSYNVHRDQIVMKTVNMYSRYIYQ